MSSEAVIRRKVNQAFKLRGLSLRIDAARYLCELLTRERDEDLDDVLAHVLDSIEKQELASNVIDLSTMSSHVTRLMEDPAEAEVVKVISAFDVPRLRYNPSHKTFSVMSRLAEGQPRPPLHASATAKADMFRHRIHIATQRLLRNKHFTPPTLSIASARHDYCPITPLDSLLGSTGSKAVLGLLTQLEDGRFFLEDLNASIPVDLSHIQTTVGLFTENCVVLAQGDYVDGVFKASVLGFPPAESKDVSRAAYPGTDFFGGGCTPRELVRLAELEEKAEDAMFVVVSDLWLDQPRVMEKFRRVLEGFNATSPPKMMVLMGNFTSRPWGHAPGDMENLGVLFDSLANMIDEFEDICSETQFILVPGPTDMGPGNVLPRPPLPRLVTQSLVERIPHLLLATNPCRIRYFTQEIVVFREDVLHKMRRNAVVPPNLDMTQDITEHLVRTLLDQSHLCPLPLHIRPVYWNYEHSLHLYPLPDVVILADRCDQYEWSYGGATAFNPSPFPVAFSFVAYYPASRTVEFSQVSEANLVSAEDENVALPHVEAAAAEEEDEQEEEDEDEQEDDDDDEQEEEEEQDAEEQEENEEDQEENEEDQEENEEEQEEQQEIDNNNQTQPMDDETGADPNGVGKNMEDV